jgi:transcriptional regulator with XRE-family HTH domain
MRIETNFQLAALIKGRREELGLTQSEFASRTMLSKRTIILIESGKGNPTIRALLQCFEALDLAMSVGPKASSESQDAAFLRSLIAQNQER